MTSPPLIVEARAGQRLGMSATRFLRDYWQKRPLLVRGGFPDFAPGLEPDDLAGLACLDGALARIVVHAGAVRAVPGQVRRNGGRWKLLTGPFDESLFARLPAARWTLLVQDVDKWHPATAELLGAFGFIPSWRLDDVMVSYATDGGGVGAHVDQYDVFLIQGLGRRRWAIDARPQPNVDFRDDVPLKLLREFRPSHEWTLAPGDLLYLPPGVPHDGIAVGECMTFSVGMRAPAIAELRLDLAARLAESAPESARFADPDLTPARSAGEIDPAAFKRARRALGHFADGLDEDALADWFGGFITRYRSAETAVPRRRPLRAAAVAARLPRARLERDP
ncbi:MAG TPA: cupin domain-containing protein, partial [Rhodanobacteraceae bacterium]|nr:cupin domain-containing protein [Rhodanobacteraceae bacterium]